MMGNIGESIVWWLKALMWLVICLVVFGAIAFGLSSCLGCHMHVMEKHTHYHGEQRQEEAATDLIERIFEGDNDG